MIGALTNHVWQSTLFAAAAGLLTIAFRKSRAEVRYWLWLSASLKFLIPFSLLIGLGSHLGWAPAARTMATRIAPPAASITISQISQPFEAPQPAPTQSSRRERTAPAIFGAWAVGFVALAFVRARCWLSIRAAVRRSSRMNIPAAVEVRSSPGLLEPGVVGWWRPILLVPAGIAERLTEPQWEAVLAHELCHVRRRDNLTAAFHMLVEAVFWFHPLVWWIGSRLVVERERACDEAVLSLGGEPHEYAQGILSVCKLYVESPLACVSGITGPDVRQRVQAILTGRVAGELSFARKAVLAVAGVVALAAPIGIGMMSARPIRAQSLAPATARFETAYIHLGCDAVGGGDRKGGEPKSGGGGPRRSAPPAGSPSPGTLTRCVSLETNIRATYVRVANGFTPQQQQLIPAVPIEGGPDWVRSDPYQINAKADDNTDHPTMTGPMMQALLEDRFKLKIHRETRVVPGYALTVATGGPKMPRFEGACTPMESPTRGPAPGEILCGTGSGQPPPNFGTEMNGSTLDEFSTWLFAMTESPVIDRTGIPGRLNFRVFFSPDATTPGALRRLAIVRQRNLPMPPADPSAPPFFTALEQQLGLKLEPIQTSRDFLVIDHVERPSGN